MPDTKDRALLRKTTWTSVIYRVVPDEYPQEIQRSAVSSRARAIRWVKTNLPVWQNPDYDVFAEVRVGTWADYTFDDVDFGRVRDAVLEDADTPRAYVQLDPTTGVVEIEWEE